MPNYYPVVDETWLGEIDGDSYTVLSVDTPQRTCKMRNLRTGHEYSLLFEALDGEHYKLEEGANKRQPGGSHYIKHGSLQPWDVIAYFGMDFFQGNILKYLVRWKDKDGVKDLEKALHYLQKYIEIQKSKEAKSA